MLRKIITPIIEDTTFYSEKASPTVIGTQIEYRLLGLLLYRKTMYNPIKYGVRDWANEWYYRI